MAAASVRLLPSTTAVRRSGRLRFPITSSLSFPRNSNPNPLRAHLSRSSISIPSSSTSPHHNSFHSLLTDAGEAFIQWDPPPSSSGGGQQPRGGGRGGGTTLVVLLGWLGAKQKHLKRYAELYNERGIGSVRFVVPVRELLGLDLGRRVEQRVAELAGEIAKWCDEEGKEEGGVGRRDRSLLFHTFSNTGWLAYGALLENLQSRVDIMERIRGCIIDSAPVLEIRPEVWAAGFSAALLKKNSSLTYSSVGSFDGSDLDGTFSKMRCDVTRPSWSEIFLLSILQKFFEIILTLPDVNQRLCKVLSVLSEKQPPCPQFYLYSSADRVIPVECVENFINKQKALGRNVYAHNFVSSPHVDHFRSFPRLYSAKIDEFLKICCPIKV